MKNPKRLWNQRPKFYNPRKLRLARKLRGKTLKMIRSKIKSPKTQLLKYLKGKISISPKSRSMKSSLKPKTSLSTNSRILSLWRTCRFWSATHVVAIEFLENGTISLSISEYILRKNLMYANMRIVKKVFLKKQTWRSISKLIYKSKDFNARTVARDLHHSNSKR